MFDETTTDKSTSEDDSEDGALKITRAEQEEDEAVEVSDESDEEEIVPDNVVPRQQEAKVEVQNEQREEVAGRQLRDRRLIQRPDRYLYEINCVEYRTPATFKVAVSGPDGSE